jgi:hypothetical protein
MTSDGEKVTRSSAGGVEALALRTTGQKQSQIKMDSGFRRNDERRGRLPPACEVRIAEANIRAANGPKGELRTQRVMASESYPQE